MTYILGIESSCDETACSIVKDGKEVLSNVISSQIDLHQEFGGVVPELACRRHIDVIIPVLEQALTQANVSLDQLDAIAVAKGPGLVGALLIGIHVAKALALSLEKPFIGVNHVEAHLYASLMLHPEAHAFPSLGVVLSGGHTAMVRMESIGQYHLIGSTVDDAVGEAFDKTASILELPYPGGPQIEALARSGDPHFYSLKAGVVKGRPLDFSFSGLKTNVLYCAKGQSSNKHSPLLLNEEEKAHLAASFQEVAFSDIYKKVLLACEANPMKGIIFGGGVCNNRRLRSLFSQNCPLPVFWPSFEMSTDNAAMIAGLGYHKFLENPQGDSWDLEASTRIPFAV